MARGDGASFGQPFADQTLKSVVAAFVNVSALKLSQV